MYGREIIEELTNLCIKAEIELTGTNAEDMPS